MKNELIAACSGASHGKAMYRDLVLVLDHRWPDFQSCFIANAGGLLSRGTVTGLQKNCPRGHADSLRGGGKFGRNRVRRHDFIHRGILAISTPLSPSAKTAGLRSPPPVLSGYRRRFS
jgi:hypothetical protein